jgi:hypothetical protein
MHGIKLVHFGRDREAKLVRDSQEFERPPLGPQKSDVLFQDANIERGGGREREVGQMYQEMV